MTLREYYALPDLRKIASVDIRHKLEANALAWTAAGGGAYYIDWDETEVVEVRENDVALVEYWDLAGVQAAASRWWYDIWNNRLYIHTSGSDSPATLIAGIYKYEVIPWFWRGYVNVQPKAGAGTPIAWAREDELFLDGNIDLWSAPATPKRWTVAVAGTGAVARSITAYDVDSAYSAELTVGAAGTAGLQENIRTRPGGRQRVRVKYLMTNAGDAASIRIRDSGSNVYLNSSGEWQAGAAAIALPNSLAWANFEIEFVAHGSYSNYQVYFYSSTANAIVYLDYASFTRFRQPAPWQPLLPASSIPDISEGVGDYYNPEVRLSCGNVRFLNDGFFYEKKLLYLWTNSDLWIRVGCFDENGDPTPFDELESVFFGYTRKPLWNDGGLELSVKDPRIAELIGAPLERYDILTFPDIESGWANKERPILLGAKTNITPPCIATKLSGALSSTGEKIAGTVEAFGHWTDCDVAHLAAIDAIPAKDHLDDTFNANSFFCLSDFNFGVPPGVTISGVQVKIVFSANDHPYKGTIRCALSADDGATWTAWSGEQYVWNEAYKTKIFGGNTALWGGAWAVADFADGVFQLKVDGKISDDAKQIRVDYVGVTVFYSTPGGIPAFTYEVSQAVFGGVTYGIDAIPAVYKKGIALATPADYSVDLPNGRFTLVADPGTDVITCDARGLKCDFETPATYSEIGADWLWFLATVINGVPEERMHVPSFLASKMACTRRAGAWLGTREDFASIQKKIESSNVMHFLPDARGRYKTLYYATGTTATTPHYRDEDLSGFSLEDDTDTCYYQVEVNYDEDPTTKQYRVAFAPNPATKYKHNILASLPVLTYLILQNEAEDLLDFVISLVRDPGDKLRTTLGQGAIFLGATDKAFFSKVSKREVLPDVQVLDEEVYRILEVSKSMDVGRVRITAVKDLQSIGG